MQPRGLVVSKLRSHRDKSRAVPVSIGTLWSNEEVVLAVAQSSDTDTDKSFSQCNRRQPAAILTPPAESLLAFGREMVC